MRRAIVVALLALAGPADASQPEIPAEQREACQRDYIRHCLGTTPGEGRVIQCMIDSFDKLSPRCAASLTKAACDPQVAAMAPIAIECHGGKVPQATAKP